MRAAQHPEAKAWTYKVLQNFRDGIDVVRLRDLPPPPPSKSCWACRFLGGSRLELGMVLSSDPGMTFQARTSAEHGRLVLPPAQPKRPRMSEETRLPLRLLVLTLLVLSHQVHSVAAPQEATSAGHLSRETSSSCDNQPM